MGKDVVLPEDHMLGAQAALNLGKIEATCIRIQRTLDTIERLQEGEKHAQLKIEAENWLAQLRTTFVPVNISINRTYKGDTELKIGQLPFLPEENDALKRAKKMQLDYVLKKNIHILQEMVHVNHHHVVQNMMQLQDILMLLLIQ